MSTIELSYRRHRYPPEIISHAVWLCLVKTPSGGPACMRAAMPPIGELCSPASADAFLRGMGTAHMDAHLKDMQPAVDLLASDLDAVLAPHDVKIEIVDD